MEPLRERLVIKEGMTTKEICEKGNIAQKVAICIFDENADGVFSKEEADKFNNSRFTFTGDELRIYGKTKKPGDGPVETVDIKKAANDYKKRVEENKQWLETRKANQEKMQAREQKLSEVLAPTGIKARQVSDIFDDAKITTRNNHKYLILTSEEYGYELTVALDETFKNPSKMWATNGEGGPSIDGFNGTLRQTKTDGLKDYYEESSEIRILNGNIKFVGMYGNPDTVLLDENATVEFQTDDYADRVQDVNNCETYELQPGTHKFPKKEKENTKTNKN